jgi:hypothetical protein
MVLEAHCCCVGQRRCTPCIPADVAICPAIDNKAVGQGKLNLAIAQAPLNGASGARQQAPCPRFFELLYQRPGSHQQLYAHTDKDCLQRAYRASCAACATVLKVDTYAAVPV